MSDHESIQQIREGQIRIEAKVDRLVSDAESEKITRKNRNVQFDKVISDLEQRVRELELWKSNVQGRILVTVTVASAIWGLVITALILIFRR